ncbi:MAG: PAS domain-containing protein, partial [Thermosynechococcus sp.]
MSRPFLLQFLKYFLPATAIIGAFFLALCSTQRSHFFSQVELDKVAKIERSELVLKHYLEVVTDDIKAFSAVFGSKFTARMTPSQLQQYKQEIATWLKTKQTYDCLFLLDAKGELRLSLALDEEGTGIKEGVAWDAEQLQRYWPALQHLQVGELFVSPFELSSDPQSTRVEAQPFLYLIERLPEGGFLVVRYVAKPLFQEFPLICRNPHLSCLLVDQRGHWLVGRTLGEEWVAKDPQRQAFTMQQQYPRFWAYMQAAPRGSWLDNQGIFVYSQVFPLPSDVRSIDPASGAPIQTSNYSLWIVAHLPAAALESKLASTVYIPLLEAFLGMWLATGVGVYLGVHYQQRRQQWQDQLAASEVRFRRVSEMAPVGIFTLDAKGRPLFLNQAMLHFLQVKSAVEAEKHWLE